MYIACDSYMRLVTGIKKKNNTGKGPPLLGGALY